MDSKQQEIKAMTGKIANSKALANQNIMKDR